MSAENPADTVTDIETALLRMWDDGNARGLDGWIGPERGEEPDDYAISERRKCADRELDKLTSLLADPADRDEKAANTRMSGRNALEWRMVARNNERRAERAEAERDRLQHWKDEASPVMIGLQDLGRALGVPLGTRITGELAAEKARALSSQVAELRATIDRVRALADAYETDATYEVSGERRVETIRRVVGYQQVADSVRAALNGGGQQ